MANTLGSLLVSLGLDAAEFRAGMLEAERTTARSMQSIGNTLRTGMELVAGYFTVSSIVGFTRSLINLQEQLSYTSEKTGIAIAALGGIQHAAEKSGMGAEQAGMMLARMGANISKAADGTGNAAKALESMGLKASELVKLPVAEQFLQITEKINSYGDSGRKGALVQAIFNRNFQQMIPLLNMGADEIRQNIEYFNKYSGVSEASAKQARQFNDRLTDFELVAKGVANAFLSSLIPAMNNVSTSFNDLIEKFSTFLTKADPGEASRLTRALGVMFDAVAWSMQGVVYWAERVIIAYGAAWEMLKHPFSASAITEKAHNELLALDKEFDKISEKFAAGRMIRENPPLPGTIKLEESLGPGESLMPKPKAPGLGGEGGGGPGKVSEAQRYLESLKGQLLTAENLTAVERAEVEIAEMRKSKTSGLTAALMEQIRATALAIEAKKAETEANRIDEEQLKKSREERERLSQEEIKAYQQEMQNLDNLEASNKEQEHSISIIGKTAIEVAALKNEWTQESISMLNANRAALAATGANDALLKVIDEQIEALRKRQQLTTTETQTREDIAAAEKWEKAIKAGWEAVDEQNAKIEQSMSESIADGIMKGFREGESFADVFINELKAQFAKTILTPIIQPMVAAGNDLISTLLGSIFPWGGMAGRGEFSGAFEMGPNWGRAGGGPVSAGGFYRVNELRPEALNVNGEKFLLMGSQGGNIDSNPALRGGNVYVNQTLHIGQGVSRNEVASAMVMAKEQAKAEILRSMRTNGAFAYGG